MLPSPENPGAIDFYKEEEDEGNLDMMIEVSSNVEILSPKRRAETWVQDETRTLIGLRRDTDGLFNTSKSNKHLWNQISSKMRAKGFDRSPTMCTDKWRNLLKEFKKVKQQDKGRNGSGKMSYYKEIDEIVRERSKRTAKCKSSATSKVESYVHFSDKGIDDTSITFGPIEANGRSTTVNLERRSNNNHYGHHPLAITASDAAAAASGVSPCWNWRETPGNGEQSNSYEERVITIKWGDYTKKIGIDGSPDAIKEAVKSAFRLRTKRPFWLEDEYNIVRVLDREMPLGTYTLHLDEGITIKLCLYDEEPDHMGVHTPAEDKTLYNEDDFKDLLSRRGWICLREYNGYRTADTMDELCPGVAYRGVVH